MESKRFLTDLIYLRLNEVDVFFGIRPILWKMFLDFFVSRYI